jgi:hypothetical protein
VTTAATASARSRAHPRRRASARPYRAIAPGSDGQTGYRTGATAYREEESVHPAIDVLDRLDRVWVSGRSLDELRYQLARHRDATRSDDDLDDAEVLGLLADLAADGLLRAGKVTWKGRRALESADRDCTGRAVRPFRQHVEQRRAA